MLARPRWLALALLGTVVGPAAAEADGRVEGPSCTPEWWDAGAIEAALSVELAESGLSEEASRIVFVVDVPCREGTIVSVLIEARGGIRRRSVDLGDLPVSARPRALAMGVAALMRAPPERLPDREPADGYGEAPPPDRTAGPEGGGPAPSTGDAAPSTDEGRPEEVTGGTVPPATPSTGEQDPLPRPPRVGQGTATESAARAWALELAGTALLSRERVWWGGAGVGLALRPAGPWRIRLGLDTAFARGTDPLGSVEGRWVATSLRVGLEHRRGRWRVGGDAGLVLDWLSLAGQSERADVVTDSRRRWMVGAELDFRLELRLAPRFALFLDLGARLHPWGSSATSPTGRVVAVDVISGLGRLGLAIPLGPRG